MLSLRGRSPERYNLDTIIDFLLEKDKKQRGGSGKWDILRDNRGYIYYSICIYPGNYRNCGKLLKLKCI